MWFLGVSWCFHSHGESLRAGWFISEWMRMTGGTPLSGNPQMISKEMMMQTIEWNFQKMFFGIVEWNTPFASTNVRVWGDMSTWLALSAAYNCFGRTFGSFGGFQKWGSASSWMVISCKITQKKGMITIGVSRFQDTPTQKWDSWILYFQTRKKLVKFIWQWLTDCQARLGFGC